MPTKRQVFPGHEPRGVHPSDSGAGWMWVCECGMAAGDYMTDTGAADAQHRHAKGFDPDFRGPA